MPPTRPTEITTLHFNLSQEDPDAQYSFHSCLKSYAINRHTNQTLQQVRRSNPLLRLLPDQALTHYIPDIALPSDSVALLQVTRDVILDGEATEHLVSESIHVPERGWQAFRKMVLKGRANTSAARVHPKLARYGVTLGSFGAAGSNDDPEYPEGIVAIQDPFDTAVALLSKHPNLLNLSMKDGGKIPAFIKERCITEVLGETQGLVDTIQILKDQWCKEVPLMDDGHEVKLDGKTVYTRVLHPNVLRDMEAPLLEALKRSQQFDELKDSQWNVQYGVTSSTYRARSTQSGANTELLHDETGLGTIPGGPFNWTVQNITPHRGLEVEPRVTYEPPRPTGPWMASGIWSVDDTTDPLTEDLVKDLLDGKLYARILTPTNPQGLIRGLLEVDGSIQPDGPVRFRATLEGKNLTPPVTTSATGFGQFMLNVTRTGLTYELRAEGLGDSATATFARAAKDIRRVDISNTSGYGTLTVTCKNHWLRHLGAYAEFLNTAGETMALPNWSGRMPGFLRDAFEPNARKRFIHLIPPIDNVMGIPLPADPTIIQVPVPIKDVHTVRMHWGGLGRGAYDVDVCPVGIVFTSVVELALPFILLLAGTAVEDSKVVQDIVNDKEVLYSILAACGSVLAGGSGVYIATAQDSMLAIKKVAIVVGPMLAKPALKGLAKYIAQKVAQGAAIRAIPLIDIAFQALAMAVTTAQLTQTIVHVLQSPFAYKTDITRSIDLAVKITPDKRFKKFPDHHASMRVSVMYDKGATNPVYHTSLPSEELSAAFDIRFSGIPAGGNLKVYVFFYAANGWVSGQAETGWLEAKGTGNTSTLSIDPLEVTTNEIPLSKESVYAHVQKTAYEGGKHKWVESKTPPSATRRSASPFKDKEVRKHLNITLAQSPAMMAYCWQATGLNLPKDQVTDPKTNEPMFTLQNLSMIADPATKELDKVYAAPKVGFSVMPGLLYDIASKDDGTGRNFFIDPTRGEFDDKKNPGGGYHLRRVALTFNGAPPDFSTATDQSFGRFPMPLDRFVLHPEGYVLGISYHSSKIFTLTIPQKPTTDVKAAMATMASGEGFRDGLINGPEAIAVALDGRILILEGGNNRVQAFDVEGNPVKYFTNPKDPNGERSPRMDLKTPENSHYLDLSVESQGYIYVLAYSGDGSSPANYRVDLYKPDGSFLVTTPNVTAAKMVVDILRSMYTMNYDVILGKDGRIEPSVSKWLPPPPAAK